MENNNFKILLAEDDHNLGTILKAYLEAKGYPTKLCVNGQVAYDTFMQENFDFCILDVMMPVKDGFTLAKDIRKESKKIPILFLTAKSLQEDIIEGLKIGADDYLTKPFSMEELLLRMKAIIRRTHESEDGSKKETVIRIGAFTFDTSRQLLKLGKAETKLTSKESDLLKLLYENANEVMDRSLALTRIWHNDSYFNARSMDVYVAKLRKCLKDDPNIEILNVHGKGFKLVINR